jgi:hypothetical protein
MFLLVKVCEHRRLIGVQVNPPGSCFEMMGPVAPQVQKAVPNKILAHK